MIDNKKLLKFKEYPVIAAVRTKEDYLSALDSKVKIIFMVGGDDFKVAEQMKEQKAKS